MVSLWCAAFFSLFSSPLKANVITSNTNLATAGYFKLSWESNHVSSYEVQEASSSSFKAPKLIYQGGDTSVVISGLADGVYYYRMRSDYGNWGEAIRVEVKHHSLKKAFTFFSIGALILCMLIWVLIRGHRHA